MPIAAPNPDAAEVIENFLPTRRGIKPRGGITRAAYVTDGVERFMPYNAASSRLFAATANAVYDISGFDPVNAPTAAISGLSSGDWSYQQTGTSGGNFLVMVNGADAGRSWDGSAFSTLSITGVSSNALNHVWQYKERIFFIEAGTLKAWFLPVDSIGGAAADISLAGIFRRGGSLMIGATWSSDSGDGYDDRWVVVSDQGEVAIYTGTDPSSASTWALEGRYDIGTPLGKNATMQAGGDLLIATVDGIVPLSEVIVKDPAALSLNAVTRPIESTWSDEAARVTSHIELHKWTEEGQALTVLPDATRMLTTNLQTGAWASQPGWMADCAVIYGGDAYIGRSDGRVYKINDSGTDDGAAFTARYCHAFSDAGDATSYKHMQMARLAFFAPADITYKVEIATDYSVNFTSAPGNALTEEQDTTSMVWGSTNWGERNWGEDIESAELAFTTEWRAVSGVGYAMAPMVQITSGGNQRLRVELVRIDLSMEIGGRVV